MYAYPRFTKGTPSIRNKLIGYIGIIGMSYLYDWLVRLSYWLLNLGRIHLKTWRKYSDTCQLTCRGLQSVAPKAYVRTIVLGATLGFHVLPEIYTFVIYEYLNTLLLS